jgi:protein SCO1/2
LHARICALLTLLLLLAAVSPAHAYYGSQDNTQPNVGIIAKPNAQVPLDATFRDEAGNTVTLGQYFTGKPIILVPVYYGCPNICTTTLNDLTRAIGDGPRELVLGRDYQIICISINPDETPELAAAKRANYLRLLGKPDLQGSWHFLTGQEPQIRRVTNAVGFYYMKDDVTGYDHAAALYMLTPQGRVASTIGGPGFSEPTVSINDQLINAGNNTIGSGVLSLARSCGLMKFNAATGRFEHNPWIWAATIGGLLILVTVGSWIGSLWVGEYKKAKRERNTHTLPPTPPASPLAGI